MNLKQNNVKISTWSQHISKLLFNIKSHDSFVIITVTQLMPPSKRREFRKDLVLDSKAWSTLKKRFLLFSYRGSCNKNDFLTSVFSIASAASFKFHSLQEVILSSLSLYSEVSNKHSAKLVLFKKIFQPTCLIRTSRVIHFWGKFIPARLLEPPPLSIPNCKII